MQTKIEELVVRLRNEGRSVVFAIPASVRRQLCYKGGDLVAVREWQGNLIIRKVDLSAAAKRMTPENSTARAK